MTSTQSRWTCFGTSIFTQMTEVANRTKSINLAQGFPDFDGPDLIKDAACEAIRSGHNQYAPAPGLLALREGLAARMSRISGLSYNPKTEVTVLSGATEALWCTIQSVIGPGDELIAFAPCYDSYGPACFGVGGTLKTVPLLPPHFEAPLDELSRTITPRTKAILVNTPHNPTGKVFTKTELEAIGELAQRHNLIVITDEVYEEILFGTAKHHCMAAFDGLRERVVVISSTSKTFSMTGWKVGYVFAPPALTAGIRAVHQFTVFCSAHPLQVAMIKALELGADYFASLRRDYETRRALMSKVLTEAGLTPNDPQGSYFMLGDFRSFSNKLDTEFAVELAEKVGVATIPISVFYEDTEKSRIPRSFLRFAFCKSLATISGAGEKLKSGLSQVPD